MPPSPSTTKAHRGLLEPAPGRDVYIPASPHVFGGGATAQRAETLRHPQLAANPRTSVTPRSRTDLRADTLRTIADCSRFLTEKGICRAVTWCWEISLGRF